MNLQAGVFLNSTPALDDTDFSGAVIFISEYNERGAVGYVVNRPFGRSLNELEEFKHDTPLPLYDGGPVDREHLFFLHRRPDLIAGGAGAGNGLYSGGDFRGALAALRKGQLPAGDLKVFIGYCGWDGGELEAEIAEGSWTVSEEPADAVFR
ncbi:MAG TPA: YqgE/AlgH family protein [Chitinophagaceae bacterium]|jgi:putative transcriptional regulator|nr:YqgE/AlgH family protein [Chitinophagaceae bacterium]